MTDDTTASIRVANQCRQSFRASQCVPVGALVVFPLSDGRLITNLISLWKEMDGHKLEMIIICCHGG